MSAVPAASATYHVELKGVVVKYNETVAGLKGVSLKVEPGEFVFLCGQTGSGKSTLLKLLTREVEETAGEVLLYGRPLAQISDNELPFLRRQLGIVPQDYGLLPQKQVWENVAYAMRAVGKSRKEVRQRVPEILEQVNMLHRANSFPKELSGGEQQRVAIARALVNEPPLLVADEPTGNLDPTHSTEIMSLLIRLNEAGTTVLVASHDIPVVQKAGRRVIELEFGEVVGDTPEGEAWTPHSGNLGYATFAEHDLSRKEPQEELDVEAESDAEPEDAGQD